MSEASILPESIPGDQDLAAVESRSESSPSSRPPASLIENCRRAVLRMGGTKQIRIGVTSALRGEGRTAVASSLAIVHSELFGRRTLLMSADPGSPGAGSAKGVLDVLSGSLDINQAVVEQTPLLATMAAGPLTGSNDEALLGNRIFADMLRELAGSFDVIVVDLPPILGSPTGALAADACGKSMLVVRAAVTPIESVRVAISTMTGSPVAFLNGEDSRIPRWWRRALER